MPLTPMPDLEPVAGAPDVAPPLEDKPHLADLPLEQPLTSPDKAPPEREEPAVPAEDEDGHEPSQEPTGDRYREERKRKLQAQTELRREREENRRLADELQALKRNVDGLGQLEVQRAMDAARAEITAAEQQHDSAFETGDSKVAREAFARLHNARARVAQLEQVTRQAAAPSAPSPAPALDPVAILRDDWLERRTWFHEAPPAEQGIVAEISDELAQSGVPAHSPAHFRELDKRLAERLPHRYARSAPGGAVTAGASRATLTANGAPPGKVELTPLHLDHMRQQGLDPSNKAHLAEMQAYVKQSRESRRR
jgi:hypothetical protein